MTAFANYYSSLTTSNYDHFDASFLIGERFFFHQVKNFSNLCQRGHRRWNTQRPGTQVLLNNVKLSQRDSSEKLDTSSIYL